MAGISKKKTNKGIKYTITYRDVFGKQHTSGLYSTKAEAKKHLFKFEKVETDKTITIGQIFNSFLKRAKNNYSINTYNHYQNSYEVYLKKYENFRYDKITSIIWQGYFDKLSKTKSPHVSNFVLKLSKAAANYALKHNLIGENVFDKIEKAKEPKADINHLNIEEIKLILNACKKLYPKYYVILYALIGTGAREGEIFALTKKDFNPDLKTISINKQFSQGRLLLKPKTSSSTRTIHLFDELVEILKTHTRNLKDDDLIFSNAKGRHINASNFRTRFFYPLLNKCNINKRIRVHDLRGSYIDMLLSSGLSIKFTQNQVGHSKSETTLNIYARNNTDMIKTANKKLNSIFEKKEKCENFVRTNKNNSSQKIIHFPKKVVDTIF